jgi:phosphatidylinositol 4-kinase
LKEEISKANQSLRMWADKYKQYKIKTHMGITIPFRRERFENFSSTMVVGIVENECSCFNTKKRVPYRIVLETIDPEDFSKYSPKGHPQKTESLMGSLDTFLQDIPENFSSIDVIETNEEKFKNFDTFVATQIKNEF